MVIETVAAEHGPALIGKVGLGKSSAVGAGDEDPVQLHLGTVPPGHLAQLGDHPAPLPIAQCMADAVAHRAAIATYAGAAYREHLPESLREALILDLIEP